MSDLREAAKALLDAYERYRETDDLDTLDDAVIDLRIALAADEVNAKDAERLDFMIDHDAAYVYKHPAKPPYAETYQVWEQDEDEEWHIISGEGRFFKSPREAIDGAIAAHDKEPQP